eukprot:CAMPEP_0181356728 /NCGR_PEP_ID=MMETSP1106-20121128/4576_1 /TAXON_ID=81844 /ORGANISM="Mantoniella antarctica, Strain SL-175" /LENGTH=42 /DNA_ID= /DNA_START= /DNA_END= /DNA_ORIENTATION=
MTWHNQRRARSKSTDDISFSRDTPKVSSQRQKAFNHQRVFWE